MSEIRVPSVKNVINRARSSPNLSSLSRLIDKARPLKSGPVQAALAHRANQLSSHDLALSLVEAYTSSHPDALRAAIIAALALNDGEIFDDLEFTLEAMLRRSGTVTQEIFDLRLCGEKKRTKRVPKPIPERWLPKAAKSQGATTGRTLTGGPSTAQLEVSKSKKRSRK
jgi:hypothetical protein